jgi:hypothetical protein
MTNESYVENLVEFEKMLGVGTNYTPEHVLKCFQISYSVKKENGELDQVGPFVDAKNHLLRNLVSSQMKAERYFEVISPFENSCSICKGTGEIYKFKRKIVQVNCHICAGKKKVKVKCPSCKGTGRFQKRWKGGGGINVSCKTCSGKKTVAAKCSECLGSGKKSKDVPDHRIKSTTSCKRCQQLGFIENKPIKKKYQPVNPVLTKTLADKIKDQIIESNKPTKYDQINQDALIDSEGIPFMLVKDL